MRSYPRALLAIRMNNADEQLWPQAKAASRLIVVCLAAMFFGCHKPSPKRQDDKTPPPQRQSPESPPAAPSARREIEEKPKPPPTPSPANTAGESPAPEKICGHAIAFAGWKESGEDDSARVCFFDPGDNELGGEVAGHRWKAMPAEAPVFFGRIRPTLVLEPGGAFTVCGAIVVRPSPAARADSPLRAYAQGMPDLSQRIGGRSDGLCGPTSAADLIYGFSLRRPAVLAGFTRGPSAEANTHASELIAGKGGELGEGSLARRMGLKADTAGATNDGIRRGLKSWLDDHDPSAWEVELAWLDDERKPAEKQATFFSTLESVGRSGGGAILCLWPGTEFADASTQQAAAPAGPGGGAGSARSTGGPPGKSHASGSGAAAGNQESDLPNTGPGSKIPGGQNGEQGSGHGGSARGFQGRKADAGAIETAIENANREIAQAERSANKGDVAAALESLGAAISLLRPHAKADARCRDALSKAKALAASLNGAVPADRPSPNLPTSFE